MIGIKTLRRSGLNVPASSDAVRRARGGCDGACRTVAEPRAGKGAQSVLRAPLPDRRGAVRRLHQATGIKINRIEAGDEQLLRAAEERRQRTARRRAADRRCSAALASADRWPVPAGESTVLERAYSRAMRDPDGNWFGFSYRARVIVYNKANVKAADVDDLRRAGRPEEQGQGLHAFGLASVQPVADRLA